MIKRLRELLNSSDKRGLTLIEILVVSSLIVFISTLVIRNFSSSRINLDRVANVLASDVRLAQQLAISARQYQNLCNSPDSPGTCVPDPVPRNRCGYGITSKPNDNADPNNDRKYKIYVGPPTIKADGSAGNCNSPIYQQSQDNPFYKSVILDERLDFVTTPRFKDIFYVPPGPTTFIQNSSTSPSFEEIIIKKVDTTKQQCNAGSVDCIRVCVYLSGRVEVTRDITCPAS